MSHQYEMSPWITMVVGRPSDKSGVSASPYAGSIRILAPHLANRRWEFFGHSRRTRANLSGGIPICIKRQDKGKKSEPFLASAFCQVSRRLPAASIVRYPSPFALKTQDCIHPLQRVTCVF